jgi:hypothetical protein
MWERIEDRLALLELLTMGVLRRRSAQLTAHTWLSELSWTLASGRRDEVALVLERRSELVALLNRVWPVWRDEHVALLEAGEPPTPAGWSRLADRQRSNALPDLPDRMNRRTAAAMTAPGSKSILTAARLDVLGGLEVVDDGLVRVRPPPGLVARRARQTLALDDVEAVLDEVGISDRALRDGLVLEGAVDAVLLVENLGAWRDMPRPERWMLVHVPGWNTATARQLLHALGEVPMIHFGDLDPNGVRIYRHLREHLPRLGWLIPAFWRESIKMHAQKRDWPDDLDLADTPALVQELAANRMWMEQERIAVDPRLPAAMEEARAVVRPGVQSPETGAP